ncbi:hypothetical protein PPSIR1_13145 [Plesiocystis pacifica SIR-1]|uniref:EamA domain-containing protein n=1 Tax=Plesiocystis pacifica SIR-1 TaxID=391625 RepID=A6GAX6_9BACT|nr:DMT family transporter [Plesiocystis pacifica]EDM76961.1 hypothetical protein PPSIR1_13145 [Plesiocystis pacifica SIR-1]
MIERAGELAALGTASCWVITALSFEASGKRIGSLSLNLVRLTLAMVPLAVWGWFTRGAALPLDADLHTWLWLGLSSLVGFVFGDLCLFRAFVYLGPRLTTLVMASVPVWAALFGLVFLGETLETREVLGMAATVGGIAWAVAKRERPAEPAAEDESEDENENESEGDGPPALPGGLLGVLTGGLAMALAGSLGQAGGLVLSKYGMADYDAFAATQIRVIVAVAGFAVVVTASSWWPKVRVALRDKPAMGFAAIGAIFGPFLGVGLSLIAVKLAPTGVAASLMALTPILMLPISWLRGEKIGLAGLLGALIAVGGVALLLL